MSFFTPETETGSRPSLAAPRGKHLYIQSYSLMRTVIGFLGILLPVALLLGDLAFLEGDVAPRGSLSAYYHSGMRDLFVGSLFVIAVFLITYKAFEHNLDSLLSTLAGVFLLGVAIFPTGRPDGSGSPATPLQTAWDESAVSAVHLSCAVIVIASLVAISCLFARREPTRRPLPGNRRLVSWRWFHITCAGFIAAGALFVVVTKAFGFFDSYSALIGESIVLIFFGLSWLVKGVGFNTDPPDESGEPSAPANAGARATLSDVTSPALDS